MLKCIWIFLFSLVFAAQWPYGHAAFGSQRLAVFVSIAPQKYFVEKIGGRRVDVRIMVQPGANPATYEPTPKQMAEISGAGLYLAVGVPFERVWLDKIAAANPAMQLVYTDNGIAKIPMAVHAHEAEEHPAGESESSQGIPDPHIWLAPNLVEIQARHIRDGLAALDPENRRVYEDKYQEFKLELEQLDAELRRMFAGKQGRQFLVFHPAWGYFARAYGLRQMPIESEGKAPKAAALKQIINHARQSQIRAIFVQPQFSAKSAEVIAREIGAEVIVADPLAADWSNNLRQVAASFSRALRSH